MQAAGGYVDDRDEGEWFLYTGSGGRDLSGNKRTNKEQSSDQKFELSNKALKVGCERGLPVRVVRLLVECSDRAACISYRLRLVLKVNNALMTRAKRTTCITLISFVCAHRLCLSVQVRSHKEKRSAYAPPDKEDGLRYDGVYKIVACWRIPGEQGACIQCRHAAAQTHTAFATTEPFAEVEFLTPE